MLPIEIVIIVASVMGALALTLGGVLVAALSALTVVGGGVLGVAGIFYLLNYFGLITPHCWWGRC